MSNPAKKIFARAIHKFHSQTFSNLPPRISSFSSSSIAHPIIPIRNFSSTSSSAVPSSDLSAPCQLWRRLSSRGILPKPSADASGMNSSSLLGSNLRMLRSKGEFGFGVKGLGIRFFSSGKGFNSVKSIAAKPIAAVGSVAEKYRKAAGLHVEAFWKRNYLLLVGAVGVGVCILLWRIMFGIASTFVGLSEGMAKYGFLALAAAMVSFAGLFIRSRFTINPDKIYRIAMRRLNTSAGMLEVMGAPLAGTDVRAYVMSGGGPKLKNFKLKLGGKRCFLIFPIRGSERRGLVSVESKKKKGQYDIKLLAVDIPMATGPDQRIFLVGDEKEYRVGGGLIFELRDPIVKAMAAEKEFDELDQKEEEEDEKNEVREAERKQEEELKILEKEKKSE